jgi:hypothetical protein
MAFFFESGYPGPLPVSVKLEQGFFLQDKPCQSSSGFQNSQKLPACFSRPQPIFGLPVGLRGLAATRMKYAGPPGPRGCYEMPENLFSYSLSYILLCKLLDRQLTAGRKKSIVPCLTMINFIKP